MVTAFPTIVPPAEQSRIIGEHSRRMQLFDATTMMELRRSGQFSRASFRRPHFMDAMHLPRWKLLALLAMPPRMFAAYQRVQAARRAEPAVND